MTTYDLTRFSDVQLFEMYFELNEALNVTLDRGERGLFDHIESVLNARTPRERMKVFLKLDPLLKPFYDKRFLRRT